jgi:hypothetical protein
MAAALTSEVGGRLTPFDVFFSESLCVRKHSAFITVAF